MTFFYGLELRHYVYGQNCECYDIGIFRTRCDAEMTAQRYLQDVPGFCDYECDYLIHEIELDCADDISHIFTYEGWNTDEDGGTVDIIDGIFPDRAQAEAAMEEAKVSQPRQSWALDCWEIGKCEWAEGFERVCSDGRLLPGLPYSIWMLEHFIEYREDCTVSFLYNEESIRIRPAAVGSKLFLYRYGDQDDSHRFTIRQLKDIYRMERLPLTIPDDPSEADEDPLEKLIALANYDPPENFDLDLENVVFLPDTEKSSEADDTEQIEDPAPEIDLTDWRSALDSLRKRGIRVTIRQEYEEPVCCSGYIAAVETDRIVIKQTQDNSGMEQATIDFVRITAVEFDDR